MFALIFGLSFLANAQDVQKDQPKGYQFTDIKRLPATSVKDQARAGTCWSWSGISFFESEMIRMGKEPIDLSAMYIVRHAYSDKATKFVRLHGSMNFAVGGAFCDVMHVIKNYGIVPMDVYMGLNYGEPNHAFGEIDDVLAGYINAVIKNSNKKLSTAWKKGFDGILDAYLGEEPEDTKKKVKSMFTDPNHLRVEDPGKVEGNPVFIYLDAFCRDEYFAEFWNDYSCLDELKAHYQRGGLGDVKVKKFLNNVMQEELRPIRERRKEWENHLPDVLDILKEGSKVAKETAAKTLEDVRHSMRIDYFTDNNLLK